MPIIVAIQMYQREGQETTLLVDKEYGYEDINTFEVMNDGLAYKIAEIAREELDKIRREKFLLDNPELNIGVAVTNTEPY